MGYGRKNKILSLSYLRDLEPGKPGPDPENRNI